MPEPLVSAPLSYFVAVAEHGSVTAAAKAMHISQPSLSVAVKKLEEEVGAQLLHRSRRGVTLTRAGELLLSRARQAQQVLGAARDELRALETEPRGRFVLGCHESLGTYVLPGFMGRFLGRHPGIELRLMNANSREVEQAIVERRVDVGLVVNPARHPDCVVQPLFEDTVTFLVASALRRRRKRPQDLLSSHPLLHVPELHQTRQLLDALRNAGIEVQRQIACSSMELVKSLVLDGAGVGVLPYRVATHGVAAGRLLPLARGLPVYGDRITLVRRADLPKTAGARALLDSLLAHGRSLPELPVELRQR